MPDRKAASIGGLSSWMAGSNLVIIKSRFKFLGQAQADYPNGVFVSTFGEHQNVQAVLDQSDRDKSGFAIIEPVVLAFERCVPVDVSRSRERDAMLIPVDRILDRVEPDLHDLMCTQ